MGTPVFIDVRCIAAIGRLGQPIKSNQSNQINQVREADDELPPPRGVRWELSEKQFSLSLSARRSSATRLSSCQQRVDASKFKPPNLTKQQTLQPQYLKGVVPLLYTPTIENGSCHSIFLPDNCLRFPFDEYTIEKRERREDRDPNMATTTTTTTVTIRTANSNNILLHSRSNVY